MNSNRLGELWAALRPLLELRPLIGILLLGAAAWVFIEIADEVIEGEPILFDEALLLALRTSADPAVPLGPMWLQEAVRDITALGSYTILMLITTATAVYLWMAGQGRVALFILSAAIGAIVVVTVLKIGFDRPRPDLVPHIMSAETASFPSGHTTASAAVYLMLGVLLARFQRRRGLRLFFVGLAVVITVLVGFSRVYLGVHWPSDVVAGWTLGGGYAVACWLAVSWLWPRSLFKNDAAQSRGSRSPASTTSAKANAGGSSRST